MTLPISIQPMITDYIQQLQQQLPDVINAVYLHGSIALNAYDPLFSDIDFLTIINRPCTDVDIRTLNRIHIRLADTYPEHQMDGSYILREDVGKTPEAIQPHPDFNEMLNPATNIHSYWVMWWLLKHRGITVMGRDASTLDIAIDWDAFRADILSNLNLYWHDYLDNPRRLAWLLTDDGIQWAVLGILRLFYTLREHAIVSKLEAGTYGLQHISGEWHRIIKEAIRIRQHQPTAQYESDRCRVVAAQQFIRYIIETCNHDF